MHILGILVVPKRDKCGGETGGTVNKNKLRLFQAAYIEIANEYIPGRCHTTGNFRLGQLPQVRIGPVSMWVNDAPYLPTPPT